MARFAPRLGCCRPRGDDRLRRHEYPLTDDDVFDPEAHVGQTHVTPPDREALAELIALGLHDVTRERWPNDRVFTYWDYRTGMFHQDLGMRIDLILASSPVASREKAALVDRKARKGHCEPLSHWPRCPGLCSRYAGSRASRGSEGAQALSALLAPVSALQRSIVDASSLREGLLPSGNRVEGLGVHARSMPVALVPGDSSVSVLRSRATSESARTATASPAHH